jgi:hypothetical protein
MAQITLNSSGVASNGSLLLQSNGTTTAVTVDASQNVGIGRTPSYKLDVAGAANSIALNTTLAYGTAAEVYSSFRFSNTSFSGGNSEIRNIVNGSGSTGSSLAFHTTQSGSGPLTERARFNDTGAFVLAGGTTLASGIGIAFPATQSASTDANTLDDYEEGTWTPTLLSTGASFTYPRGQYGSYCKIGSLVYAQFYIGADASGTTSNSCQIASLPFASQNLGSLAQSSAFAWISRPTLLGFTVGNNASTIDLWLQNGGLVFATASQVAGGYIVGSVIYRAA